MVTGVSRIRRLVGALIEGHNERAGPPKRERAPKREARREVQSGAQGRPKREWPRSAKRGGKSNRRLPEI